MTAAGGNLEGGKDRPTQALRISRAQEIATMLISGKTRQQVLRFASENWGMPVRTCDRLIADARQIIIDDWQIDRQQLLAQLLSALSVLQLRALHDGNLAVCLGAINAQARLCGLFDLSLLPPAPSVSFTNVNVTPPAASPPSGNWVRGLPHGDG
ncbi:hypothetical protein [Cyanobium sp. Lug-B]|uniref:hypothetical protein n=1 Tax=Cyanobium sp. Lug-B TaxID=2823716 RepID=UPI0020CE937E|nr:hypothetical protein [Cyanobium sp. Lug-B]MCP9796105.1 hypothetical protein [Cyanobium sp. Lug-B]